jgi:predicted transcriptional regulator
MALSYIKKRRTKKMQTAVKENALNLIRSMPENTTWDDIMYEIYVKQKIEKGLEDIEKGQVTSHEKVKEMFVQR